MKPFQLLKRFYLKLTLIKQIEILDLESFFFIW